MTEDGRLHVKKKRRTFGKLMEDLMHNVNITDGACRLYAHMHWRYGQNKRNWEGQKSMAGFFEVDEKTIGNRIRELEAADWVIVIERGFDPKTKRYLTNFYHIFETQKDCQDYRKSYASKFGERLRSKGEGRKRVSRKGIGNTRERRQSAGTQVPVDQRNSSSDGNAQSRRNLSSDNLDSSRQPDSISFSPKKSPQFEDFFDGNQPVNADIKKAVTERQQLEEAARLEREDMLAAIREIFDVGGAQASNYLVMLRGTAKKKDGDWYTYQIEGGITAAELRQWAAYYPKHQVKAKDGEPVIMVKELGKLNGYITSWIEKGKPAAAPVQSSGVWKKPEPAPAPSTGQQPSVEERRAAVADSQRKLEEARRKKGVT